MEKIPLIHSDEDEEPRISGQTFCQLFDNHSQFDEFFIVDCRTEREYNGGHIKSAIRCHPFEKENNIFNLYRLHWKPTTCFIFHCEFSSIRGPAAYRLFIKEHQNSNNSNIPVNAFILDGGYNEFFSDHEDYCVGTYIKEIDLK